MPDVAMLDRSLSVRQLAQRWAISPRKVRAMIRRRLVSAIDIGFGRRQLRITPEALAEAEHRLAFGAPATQRRRPRDGIDPAIAAILDAD